MVRQQVVGEQPNSQSFSKGWVSGARTPYAFDPMKMGHDERQTWAEVLGMTYDLAWSKQPNASVHARPWDPRQIEFYARRLDDADYVTTERRDGRSDLYIRNGAIVKFTRERLPAIDPDTEDSILSGLLSGVLVRTELERNGHKLLHITKAPVIAETVRDLAHLRKLHIDTNDYTRADKGHPAKCYSTWFLKPHEVKEYVPDDFSTSLSFLDRLPDWTENYRGVLLEKTNFARHTTYMRWQAQGRLSVSEATALLADQKEIRGELKKIEGQMDGLTGTVTVESYENGGIEANRQRIEALKTRRIELEKKYDAVETRLFKIRQDRATARAKRKAGGNGYARANWRNTLARAREGQD